MRVFVCAIMSLPSGAMALSFVAISTGQWKALACFENQVLDVCNTNNYV